MVYGAYRDDPKYLKKWMITNGIIYVVLLILVLGILFTGYFRMYLTQTQFISALAAISVIAGVRQFSWLVVFQYRWNLLRLEEVKKFELEEGMYQLCLLTHFVLIFSHFFWIISETKKLKENPEPTTAWIILKLKKQECLKTFKICIIFQWS